MKSPRVFLPAILSGVLLWSAYFPLDLGPVALIALVPFLTLVRAEGVKPWQRYGAALVGGLTFSVLALKWVRVAHESMVLYAWPALSLYVAVYWPAALFLLRCLDSATCGLPSMTGDPRDGATRRPPLALTLPIVWVALEYCRANFPTGFPVLRWVGMYQSVGFGWYFLGYTQHRILPLIQSADVGGVYLVSLFVAAANGAVYEWATRLNFIRGLLRSPTGWIQATYYREFAVTAGVIGLGTVMVIYGGFRLTHQPFAQGPLVAAVQGNLTQDEKDLQRMWENGPPPLEREYFPLVQKARGDATIRVPDLIVWPETCYPDNWNEVAAEVPETAANARVFTAAADDQNYVLETLRKRLPKANMLLGLNRLEWLTLDNGRRYNSALLVDADGAIRGHYDKTHLVPFGEYVPLRSWLPWLQSFTPYKHDYSCTPGNSLTRFELPAANGKAYRFGVMICYEDSDPYFARQYNSISGKGPPADFLVNISNDGWFNGTEEHEQHLAICRFRAIEARRSVVRAVNMGISAVIDPDGRVLRLPNDTWESSKRMSGVVRAEVPVDDRDSVYAATGDWVPVVCWVVLTVAHFTARRKRANG